MANSPFCYKTHKQCFWLVWYGKERQAEKGSWKQRLGWRKEGREEVGKVGRVAVNNDTRTVSLRLVWQTHTLCIHHKVINQTKSHCIFALREWHSIKTITLTWHGDTGIKRVCECWQRWVPGTRVGDESTAAEMLSLLLCVLVVTDERRCYPCPQICTANGAALVNKDQLGKMKQKLWAWKAKKCKI